MLESLNLLILLHSDCINNRSSVARRNSHCHILTHLFWDEALQKEGANRGKAIARTAFPVLQLRPIGTDYSKRNQTKRVLHAAYQFNPELAIFCIDPSARSLQPNIDLLATICNRQNCPFRGYGKKSKLLDWRDQAQYIVDLLTKNMTFFCQFLRIRRSHSFSKSIPACFSISHY